MLPSILLAVVALFFMIKWWLETKKTQKSLNKEVLAQKERTWFKTKIFRMPSYAISMRTLYWPIVIFW